MKDDENSGLTEDEKIIKAAKDCLEDYLDREADNLKRAKDAIRFRSGEQWPLEIRTIREDPQQDGGSRPCPVLDKTDQYVKQVVNEERQNRAAIRIRPIDDGADPKTAEIFNGLVRHIEEQSEAVEAYCTAGEHAIDGGFGFLRILADYCDDMSFDQEIRIKRIRNRFSVFLGPHEEIDGSDAKEGGFWEDVPRETFKQDYPNAKEIPFQAGDDWSDPDNVRVAEYYRIEGEKVKIHLMPNGRVIADSELKDLMDEIEQYNNALELNPPSAEEVATLVAAGQPVPGPIQIPEPQDTRTTTINRVKWYKVTSEEVLEKADVVGRYIPIIKVTGDEIIDEEGKSRVKGMIEPMMDAQRLHNYSMAGYIENVALAPRAPWVAEEGQIEGYEDDYKDANTKPIAVLKYKAMSTDEGQMVPPPMRQAPPGIPVGWQQMLMNTEQSVGASVGMYGASVGQMQSQALQERSGVALIEQKTQGAIGTFHFPDNLRRSIQQVGRILLEWIPKYYDTERVVRIIGEDGESENVKINPNGQQSVTEEQDEFNRGIRQVYNLSVGKYDVTASTGPSYTSKRQEAADTQLKLVQADPDLMQVIGDILFKNIDMPGSEQISERLKTMLPPEIQMLEANDKVDPAMQAMMKAMQAKEADLQQKLTDLQQYEQQVISEANLSQGEKAKVDAAKRELESAKKIFNSELKAEMANIEMQGEKMKNQIIRSTDKLVEELKAKAAEPITVEEDQAMTSEIVAAIEKLSEFQASSVELVNQSTAESIQKIAELFAQPRTTAIEYDENMNPIRSVSRVGQ